MQTADSLFYLHYTARLSCGSWQQSPADLILISKWDNDYGEHREILSV